MVVVEACLHRLCHDCTKLVRLSSDLASASLVWACMPADFHDRRGRRPSAVAGYHAVLGLSQIGLSSGDVARGVRPVI